MVAALPVREARFGVTVGSAVAALPVPIVPVVDELLPVVGLVESMVPVLPEALLGGVVGSVDPLRP